MRQKWEFSPNHTKYCSKSRYSKLPYKKITPNTMEYATFSIIFKQPLTYNIMAILPCFYVIINK